MKNIGSTLATVWRLASPYFRSEDRWAGLGLLAAVIAIELMTVAIDVILNQWRNRFYNALQDHNWDSFVYEILFFTVVVTVFVGIAVYQLYLNQWLQIRWRRWMTERYLEKWLAHGVHYRMQLQGDPADNPDQRIAEDVRLFIEQVLVLGLGLLNAIVSLASFVVILWGLSGDAPLHLFGTQLDIPGYLVWAALIYSIFGTWLTHLVGWPLVGLSFRQQKFEADFRFNLVRVRENSEQIALLKGEAAEHGRLSDRLGALVTNWLAIMSRTKKITAFTTSYAQAAQVYPYVLVAPAYFAGKTQLGGMMQAASAFLSVQGALSFFVSAYRQLAEWQAIVARLDGFEASVAAASAGVDSGVSVADSDQHEISVRDLQLNLPAGAPLIAAQAFTIKPDDRILLTGPTGAGKSTLFRALAGIWPFGHGKIAVPQGASLMMLPQRPYFPIGPLADAIAYPAAPGSFTPDQLGDALHAVGLTALVSRLDDHDHWNRLLSLGEQQRLGLARALLQAPQFLFLDEATASLDEPSEAALYDLIEKRLPNTAIVSIGHRSTLDAFHQRQIAVSKNGPVATLAE